MAEAAPVTIEGSGDLKGDADQSSREDVFDATEDEAHQTTKLGNNFWVTFGDNEAEIIQKLIKVEPSGAGGRIVTS
ncbi:hypothetical protein AAC387_Pa12g0661 [Persea americana]